jgi:phage terminase large subunit-like protein
VPDCHHNDGGLVVELAESFGTKLDPWQADAVEIGCGVREDGLWAAPTYGINQARQNGKSVVLVVRALAGVLLFGEKTVIVSAHQQKTSRVLFQSVESYFAGFPDLTKRVRKVTSALGREEIVLKSGALIAFPARTRQTLRGWSVDCYLADEAQLVTDDQWASAKPSMAARRGSQVWMAGTAPSALGDADVFGRLRQAAIAGTDESLAWLEYGATPGCDLDDREQWAAANPGRVELEAIMSERRELSPEDFAKERLNIWPTEQTEHVFGGPEAWQALEARRRDDVGKATALGLDRSPDGLVAVTAAYRDFDDETIHVEPVFVRDGVTNMTEVSNWVRNNVGPRIPIVVDSVSTAATAVTHLQSARRNVVTTHAGEMVRACVGFSDDVRAGVLSHADSPSGVLALAVEGARRRPVGDAGGWAWDRRDGSAAVSPLVSASLAHYGALAYGRRPPRGDGQGRRGFVM